MRCRPLALVLFLVSALLAGACGGKSPEEKAADREEIQAFLEEYLPKMAQAYRTGDVEPIVPYSTEKERAAILSRVRDLARTGQVLAPELASVEVEAVTVWSAVNAFVSTVEVWDVRVLASGTEAVVREEPNQPNRVKYQLKREDGRWRVFGRQLEET
ncbi:MAG TPA: hypothetical protein VLF66_14400, partial [Thermoanaerobaculia bacterium]|nr:hypothetical protein [Thermoanaerobaculia bacterium]